MGSTYPSPVISHPLHPSPNPSPLEYPPSPSSQSLSPSPSPITYLGTSARQELLWPWPPKWVGAWCPRASCRRASSLALLHSPGCSQPWRCTGLGHFGGLVGVGWLGLVELVVLGFFCCGDCLAWTWSEKRARFSLQGFPLSGADTGRMVLDDLRCM